MLLRIVVCAVVFLAVSFAQSPAAQAEGPQFEVVSIKPAPEPTPETIRSGASRIAFEVSGARVQIIGYTPLMILARAFRIEPSQIDARDFARRDFFEIQAKLPVGATPEQVPEMLQAMLAERFKLAYHREIRQYQMNVLTVGKSGMKLPRLPDGTQLPSRQDRLLDGGMRTTQTGTVASLFAVMNSFGGLRLVDETGLEGIYTWVQNVPAPTPGISYQDALQDSFKVMIEAAGLKLETRKVPKETIIIDQLEKNPTEN